MRQKLTGVEGAHLTRAWDANAQFRAAELFSNDDSAYRSLTYHIEQHLAGTLTTGDRVLDVGCGVGALTESLGGLGYDALGIDPSEQSIKLAKRYNPAGNYQAASLEKFALKSPAPFRAVVANMVLHSVPDLGGFLAAARSILDENGMFIATIPHPRYYLQQRPDVMFSESDYDDCRLYWLNFRIHGKHPHPTKVPYFHRPTEDYVTLLTRNRFAISEFEAPPQVGIGKPHDILLIVSDRLSEPLPRAA